MSDQREQQWNAAMRKNEAMVLHGLRAAVLKARLIENELLAIGVSLKHGMIEPEGVMRWLHEEGLMFLMPEVFTDAGSTATSAASASLSSSPSSPASGASPTS